MPAWVRPFLSGVITTVMIVGAGLLLARPDRGEPIEVLIATPAPGVIGVSVSGAVQRPGVYEIPSGSRVADLIQAAGGATEGADPATPSRALRLRDEMHIHVPLLPVGPTPAAASVPPPPRPTERATASADASVAPPSAAAPTPTAVPVTEPPVAPTMATLAVETTPVPVVMVATTAPPPFTPVPQPASDDEPEGLVNVNTATAAQLEELPGIGPALASRIVADRERNGPYASVDDLQRVSGIGPATVARLRARARV